MNTIKIIGLTLMEWGKQIWKLPLTLEAAHQRRQQRKVANDLEEERLDRIRNPLKYRGKE